MQAFEELATLYGVHTGYRDAAGRWQASSRAVVVEVLEALEAGEACGALTEVLEKAKGGAQLDRSLRHALALRRAQLRDRLVDTVLVAWDGVPPSLSLASGDPAADREGMSGLAERAPVRFTLRLESGEEESWERARGSLRAEQGGSEQWGLRRAALPFGYHVLKVEEGDREAEATIISAPRRCWTADRPANPRRRTAASGMGLCESAVRWGVVAPLYSLHSDRDWGAGDLAELGALRESVAEAGGHVVATLPLLASYLDRPFEPGPYRPVSRMFWNEFYLAVDQIPEWEVCDHARRLWDSERVRTEVTKLRTESLVDYAGVMALKRSVLEALCRCFFERGDAGRSQELAAFVETNPEVVSYATFRARVEGFGADWRSWPQDARAVTADREVLSGLQEAERYHLYCQWQMEDQLGRISSRTASVTDGSTPGTPTASPGLLLDLPVGVHPGGFDTWRWRGAFVQRMSVGAPPDSFFAGGQDWQTPPLHPERMRERGHEYFVRCLRHHMRHASYLRIDHVMSLHRLFWVPEGRQPAEGVYVRYPADELYAVLCLESNRHHTTVVGEDLGTVPAGVRATMRRRGVLGTWVMQGALRPRAHQVLDLVPRHTVAALGTHDMFPLLGFLRGDDITARIETGQLDPSDEGRARAARRHVVDRLTAFLCGEDAAAAASEGPDESVGAAVGIPVGAHFAGLLYRALAYLATSGAALSLVSLDDLLLETRPQNLPGTGLERDNWRRRAARPPGVVDSAIKTAGRVFGTAGPGWKRASVDSERGQTRPRPQDDSSSSAPTVT